MGGRDTPAAQGLAAIRAPWRSDNLSASERTIKRPREWRRLSEEVASRGRLKASPENEHDIIVVSVREEDRSRGHQTLVVAFVNLNANPHVLSGCVERNVTCAQRTHGRRTRHEQHPGHDLGVTAVLATPPRCRETCNMAHSGGCHVGGNGK